MMNLPSDPALSPDLWLSLLLEHLPVGMLLCTPDGRTQYANLKALQSMKRVDGAGIAGAPAIELPIIKALLKSIDLDAVLKAGRPVPCRASRRTGFDHECAYDGVVIPLLNDDAPPAGLMILFGEQPNPIETDRTLIQAEKFSALNTIIAGVAHELNNPLTAVLGSAQLLLQKTKDESTLKRLRRIAEETERCGKIISNLLTYARRHEVVKSKASINQLIEDTLAMCGYQLQVDGITVEISLDPAGPLVNVQSIEMQRVFLGLVTNAHRSMGEIKTRPGKLMIRTEVRGNKVRICFADNGPGVPVDLHDRIFDPFFTTRNLGDGMGLGLSVAYGVVQDHGGRMWLESAEDAGASFYIELPAVEVESE